MRPRWWASGTWVTPTRSTGRRTAASITSTAISSARSTTSPRCAAASVDWQRDGNSFQEKTYYLPLIGDEAVQMIEKQDKNKPFFLYFASLAPHAPYQARKADEDRYASTIKDPIRRIYAAMITSLDDQVGRIVAALEKKGLRKNTLIIFSSDNGGPRNAVVANGAHSKQKRAESGVQQESLPASNGDLRGGKGRLHEGGVRVPTIFYWPAKLKPRVVNQPLHMVDIMPTALALAGAKPNPADKPLDGMDIWATVAEGKPSPHDDILVNVEAFRGAIIKGKWKADRDRVAARQDRVV